MAVLYVTELADLGQAGGNSAPIAQLPVVAEQAITFTTHTESSAFNPATRYVRLHTDTVCFVKFGTAPTAITATNLRLAANQTEYFAVPANQSYKVSVVS